MPRCSEDKGHVNNNGLLLLDLCKQTGLRVMNGRVGKDSGVGKYTFVGSRGRSVVDYMLASQSLFTLVKNLKFMTQISCLIIASLVAALSSI